MVSVVYLSGVLMGGVARILGSSQGLARPGRGEVASLQEPEAGIEGGLGLRLVLDAPRDGMDAAARERLDDPAGLVAAPRPGGVERDVVGAGEENVVGVGRGPRMQRRNEAENA